MSTEWRFLVGGIYRHLHSGRTILILAESGPRVAGFEQEYRHVSAYPLNYGNVTDTTLKVFLDWDYPIEECSRKWQLVRSVAVNPRTSEEP